MVRQTDKKEKKIEEHDSEPASAVSAPDKTPVSRTTMLIGAVVVVLLIGLALWQMGAFTGTPAKPNPGTNTTINTTIVSQLQMPQAAQLSGLINKTKDLPNSYKAAYMESEDNNSRAITIQSDGIWTSVSVQAPLYVRTFYWKGNETVLCEDNNQTKVCQVLDPSDDHYAEAQQMEGMTFPGPGQSGAIWQNYVRLINSSLFKFNTAMAPKNVAGRTCAAISYQYGENNLTICLDQQYGVVLEQEMTYNQPYQTVGSDQTYYRKANYRLTAQTIGFSTGSVLAPDVANNTQAADLATSDDEKLTALMDCAYANDSGEYSRCLKDSAISFNDVRFCSQNENASAQGDCVIKVATQAGQLKPELCPQAGSMMSDCYANIAYLKNDKSYCLLVTDATLKAACEQALTPTNQTKSG